MENCGHCGDLMLIYRMESRQLHRGNYGSLKNLQILWHRIIITSRTEVIFVWALAYKVFYFSKSCSNPAVYSNIEYFLYICFGEKGWKTVSIVWLWNNFCTPFTFLVITFPFPIIPKLLIYSLFMYFFDFFIFHSFQVAVV